MENTFNEELLNLFSDSVKQSLLDLDKRKEFEGFNMPEIFPIKNLNKIYKYRGFDEILTDLSKIDYFKTEKEELEYCNSLFWYISLIQNNKDKYFYGLSLISDIHKNKIKEKSGQLYFAHFLKLLRIYELSDWQNGTKFKNTKKELEKYPNIVQLFAFEEGKEIPINIYRGYYYFFLASHLKDILIGIKKGILIYPTEHHDISSFFSNVSDIHRTKFFIACSFYLKRKYHDKYSPFDFLNLVNEYLSIAFEMGNNSPLNYLEAILEDRENATTIQKEVERNALLYCILLGIKYNIGQNYNIVFGLEDVKKPSIRIPNKIKLEILYTVLNSQARILGCSPDQDSLVPILEYRPDPIPADITEEQNRPDLNPIDLPHKQIININSPEDKIEKAVWALVYYYQQAAGIIPYFENHNQSKKAALTEVAEKLGFSFGAFKNIYLPFCKNKTKRVKHNKGTSIKLAIALLKNYPEALEIALKDVKEIEGSLKNIDQTHII